MCQLVFHQVKMSAKKKNLLVQLQLTRLETMEIFGMRSISFSRCRKLVKLVFLKSYNFDCFINSTDMKWGGLKTYY